MPSPDEILSGLLELANRWRGLAIFWHVYFSLLAGALFVNARLSKRIGGILLSLPLLSVAALASLGGNLFNSALFLVSGAALIGIAAHLPREEVRITSSWAVFAGSIFFAFGWAYPHFLSTSSYLPYLYAAPTGIIPCPTLSIIIGLGLAVGGLDSRAWSLLLGTTGMFYGTFGALVLGIAIDWILAVGAGLLIIGVAARGTKAGTRLLQAYGQVLRKLKLWLPIFFEHIFRPGFSFEYGTKGFPRKLLRGKSARIVVTMGMPAFLYRWYFGAHSLKSLERNILRFCGIGPISECLFGLVETASESTRQKWLENLRKLGAAAR